MRKSVKFLVIPVVLITFSAGCAATATHADSPAGSTDTAPADVTLFPNGFRNVAHKCDGPNMIYSLSSGSNDRPSGGLAVVPNDPRCSKTAG